MYILPMWLWVPVHILQLTGVRRGSVTSWHVSPFVCCIINPHPYLASSWATEECGQYETVLPLPVTHTARQRDAPSVTWN